MLNSTTKNTRKLLSSLTFSGLDRLYQQLDGELGVILTIHHVNRVEKGKFTPNAHLTITPEFFETVLDFLDKRGFDFVSLDEAHKRILDPQPNAPRFVSITFDDGYKNTLEEAAPILQSRNIPYAVYVAPGLIAGTGVLWWEGIETLIRQQDGIVIRDPRTGYNSLDLDCSTIAKKYDCFGFLLEILTNEVPEKEQSAYVRDLCQLYEVDLDAIAVQQLMTWWQVHELIKDPLCTLGAHTLNHEALARLTPQECAEEVMAGVDVLEAETGVRAEHFAYPYGYHHAAASREFNIIKDLGFKTAVTTRGGMIFPAHKDHFTALPRISVNGLFQKIRYFSPLVSGLPTRLSTGLRRLDVA